MLFHVEQDGTMLSAEITGMTLNMGEVETAFNAVTGLGQAESYGAMLVSPMPDLSMYYIDAQLCGILSKKIIARPDLEGLTTEVQGVARTIAGKNLNLFL